MSCPFGGRKNRGGSPNSWQRSGRRASFCKGSWSEEAAVQPAHGAEAVQRDLQEGAHLQAVGRGLGAAQEAADLMANLAEVPAGALRRPQPRALDVVDAVPLGQAARDLVAGGPVFGEPVVAEEQDGRLFSIRSMSKQSPLVCSVHPAHASGVVNRSPWAEAPRIRSGTTAAACGPLSTQAILRAWRETEHMSDAEAMQHQDPIGWEVFASEDAKEGIRAFREKRPPVWKAR